MSNPSMKRKPRLLAPSRRAFLQLTAASAAAAVVGPVRLAFAAEATSEAPRVLVVGDSMIAGGFGIFLSRALAKEHGYRVHRRGKSSTGLARPDFFDWHEEAQRLVEKHPPDVSVVMFGGNDVQGLYMGKGKWIRWHEPGWAEEYAKRVQALCDILAPEQQQIFWVGLPIMRPTKFRRRVQKVNTIYRAEMAIRPGATFIDTWDVMADEEGEYADRIALQPAVEGKKARRVRVRAGDGIHLSPAGAEYLKEYVLQLLLPELAALRA